MVKVPLAQSNKPRNPSSTKVAMAEEMLAKKGCLNPRALVSQSDSRSKIRRPRARRGPQCIIFTYLIMTRKKDLAARTQKTEPKHTQTQTRNTLNLKANSETYSKGSLTQAQHIKYTPHLNPFFIVIDSFLNSYLSILSLV